MSNGTYTLRNVQNHEQILAESTDLAKVLLVKLWNAYHYDVTSVIYDADGDVVNRQTLNRFEYQVELSVRPNPFAYVEADFLAIK